MRSSKMFDSPTTRVCSVRLNDVETLLALQVLRQMGVDEHVTSFSKLARACVAIVALQAEKYGIGEPTVMQAREALNTAFGGVGLRRGQEGVRNEVYSEMRHQVDRARNEFAVPDLQMGTGAGTAQPSQQSLTWWQQLGCCSEEECLRFTEFLTEHGVTARECSYVQWQKHINGIKPFVKATETSEQMLPPELAERAAEREHEANEQKRLMDEFLQQQASGDTGETK